MMWLVTALSLAGVVLNIYKQPVCFALWCVTNAAWIAYDIAIGAHAQAAMFAVYLATSVWGLVKWTREKTRKETIVIRPSDIRQSKLFLKTDKSRDELMRLVAELDEACRKQ